MSPSAAAARTGKRLAGSTIARRSLAECACSERSSGGGELLRLELDAVRSSAPDDESLALQLVQRARHGLARGADHLAEEIVREGEVEPDPVPADASVVAGELDQLAAHAVDMVQPRSEEHTSELQSRRDLVCR